MKLAVIGLGAIAPFYLDAIEDNPQLSLVAVCDSDQAKLDAWPICGVASFTSYHDLLDAQLADGVVITLPNDLHATVSCDILMRGMAVCCEKPMTITVAEAEQVVSAAQRGGAVFFTAFHRRYNRHLLDLANRLPVERSQIACIVARYHENIEEHTGGDCWYLEPARCGGGCIIDNGTNALDCVRHLLGDLTLVDATIGDVRSGNEFYAELDLISTDGVRARVELDWALPTGETKDIVVELHDGTQLTANMLEGYEGFKSSLSHEYSSVVTAFCGAVQEGPSYHDLGTHLVSLVADAYATARTKEERLRMSAKDESTATVVRLLFHSRTDRGMTLSPWTTRCVRAGEVHELVTTTDRPTREGDRIDQVGFLCFAEFQRATVIERGDAVWLGRRTRIGTIVGFDECHMPNHLNILIKVDLLITACEVDLRPGEDIRFVETQR